MRSVHLIDISQKGMSSADA